MKLATCRQTFKARHKWEAGVESLLPSIRTELSVNARARRDPLNVGRWGGQKVAPVCIEKVAPVSIEVVIRIAEKPGGALAVEEGTAEGSGTYSVGAEICLDTRHLIPDRKHHAYIKRTGS